MLDFENRLVRLEDKVDDIKTEVTEIKADVRIHMHKVDEHIAGDKKIINEWKPIVELVPELKEIIENYKYEKMARERRNKTIGLAATLVGIAAALVGIFKN